MRLKRIVAFILVAAMLSCCAAFAEAPARAYATQTEMSFETKAAVSKGKVSFSGVPSTMIVGQSYKLGVKTTLGSGLTAYITTSNTNVLRLFTSGGYVYASPQKAGKAKVTAKIYYRGKTFKASKTIKTKQPAITSVSVESTASTTVGGTYTLNPSVTPSSITNPVFTFASSNSSVASVSSLGVVTGVKEGTATITVSAGGKSAKCLFTVTAQSEPVTGDKRAFLFGMSLGDSEYSGFEFNALPSVYDEILSVGSLFGSMNMSGKYYLNYKKAALVTQMKTWKNGASSDGTTYVYYSGHGAEINGVLQLVAGTDATITATQLKSILDTIPGKIVLLLNCCNSGSAIGKSIAPAVFAKAFVSQFAGTSVKSGEFVDGKYTVICACRSDEYGWIANGVDLFGDAFTKSLGWSLLGKRSTGDWQADSNNDGSVTVSELTTFMRNDINAAMRSDPELAEYTQSLVSYPASSSTVLFSK